SSRTDVISQKGSATHCRKVVSPDFSAKRPLPDPRALLANWWKGRDSKCPANCLKNKKLDLADRLSAPSRTPTASALEGSADRRESYQVQCIRSPGCWSQ